ncbi:MAG: biotin-dependent carboxyltransferase family protein [Halieaceae bacterium]|nr:biotin-dependent carboxyltransferase family protein [Halieaceae bacterium]
MSGFSVLNPGMLSLLQDGGRYGQHRIGLTNGGPLDRLAMSWANRLVHNDSFATAIEASFGGLKLEAQVNTLLAVTGGDQALTINGAEKATWRSHRIEAGDIVELGFAQKFCRSYLAVHGGFDIAPSFGSTATVVREGIGGLDGGKLDSGDTLPARGTTEAQCLALNDPNRRPYQTDISVRVLPGYQQHHFPRLQQRRFFAGAYTVTERADRMGYRLEGPVIQCDIKGILSEGICMGAIQVPADGQPIVLLQDRQTIGGYPKIGSALSLDTGRLAQLMPGATVRFEPVTPHAADNLFHMARSMHRRMTLDPIND